MSREAATASPPTAISSSAQPVDALAFARTLGQADADSGVGEC